MNRNPQFRYPPSVQAPRPPDYQFLPVLGTVTIASLLGCLFVVCKMLGWL